VAVAVPVLKKMAPVVTAPPVAPTLTPVVKPPPPPPKPAASKPAATPVRPVLVYQSGSRSPCRTLSLVSSIRPSIPSPATRPSSPHRLARRHTGHDGVVALVSCSAHTPRTRTGDGTAR
jgi:hypothetical protein